MKSMTHDVFLSYSRRDQQQADAIHRLLGDRKMRIFFDKSNLTAGYSWISEIEKAIDNSKAIVILIGPTGLGNTQQYERDYAIFRATKDPNFRVIPVLLPGCPGISSGFLVLKTWIDLRDCKGNFADSINFNNLIDAITGTDIDSSVVDICPYLGLETFREEDSVFFYGRESETDQLESKLKSYNFVSVVGPSGSGKSSLIQAGMIPRLRKDRSSKPWRIVSLKPGPYPFQGLVSELSLSNKALSINPEKSQKFFDDLAINKKYSENDIHNALAILLGSMSENNFRTLIYIDAWEELYAAQVYGESTENLAQREMERSIFINFLLAAAGKNLAKVVVSVRADAYATLLRHSQLSDLWPERQVNLYPMSPKGLREAIVKPAEEAGLTFEPNGLVDDILLDVTRETDGLPLLQVALKETWKNRVKNTLTRDAYMASGRVDRVLDTLAERVYSQLNDDEKSEVPRLLLNMIGSSDDGFETLRRIPMPANPLQRAIVDKLSAEDTRLLVVGVGSNPDSSEAAIAAGSFNVVEIAHASLLRTWLRLREWIAASADRMRLKAEIEKMKDAWEAGGRTPDALIIQRFQLERAKDLLKHPGHVWTHEIEEFIKASAAHRDQEDEDRLRAEALKHAQKVESAASNIIRAETQLQKFSDDLKIIFGFDFVLLQMIDRYDSTIATVAASGLREDWIGIGKHYLHGNGATPDIQSYIATANPPVIEVISGNDDRFDGYIFRKFGHAKMSRAFLPIIFCANQDAVTRLKWVRSDASPNTSRNISTDCRTIFKIDDQSFNDVLKNQDWKIIGTVETGYYNQNHALIADEVVSVFERMAKGTFELHEVSLESALQTVAEVASRMVGADAATVGMCWNQEDGTYAFNARVGIAPPPGLTGGSDATARSARRRSGAVTLPPDSGADGADFEADYKTLKEAGFETMIVVPIMVSNSQRVGRIGRNAEVADRSNGLLRVFFRKPRVALGRQVAWLEYLSRRAADAVRNIQYIIKINEDERQLSNLHRVTVRLSRNYLKEGLLDEIAGSAANMFAADVVTVFEYREADKTFSNDVGLSGQLVTKNYTIECCDDESFAPRRLIKSGDHFYESNVKTNDIVRYNLGGEQARPNRFLTREGIVAVAGVILRAADEVVGTMFINYRRSHVFEQKEKDMIETLAATAAVVIKNRRMVSIAQAPRREALLVDG